MIHGKRNTKHSEENNERWLLTYSDLITLLLGLFVILYAMSKIDSEKYSQIVAALEGAFGKERAVVLNGHKGIMKSPMPALDAERAKVSQEISDAIGKMNTKNLVSLTHNERGVTIHIMEEMLFTSGSAEIKSASLPALDTLAAMLKNIPNDIRIEGHTDNIPIATRRFPSNWHLSVERALNVGYYIISKHNLNPEKISVVGYSEYKPLTPNDTEEHRSKNRRVDIVIITSLANSAAKK